MNPLHDATRPRVGRRRIGWLMSIALLSSLGCSSETPVIVTKQPRPVTVLKLRTMRPQSQTRYTGSVSAWKVEDIGFEVGGRIISILEPGTEIKGAQRDEESGKTNGTGDEIARIDQARYEIQLSVSEAKVQTAKAQRDAVQTDLDKVLPQQIVAAEVDLKLKIAEYGRQKELFDNNAGTQTELDQALANRDSAVAMLSQLNETTNLKKAELQAYESQIAEALEAVERSKRDLADTTLRAPFSGRISQSYKTLGSVVQPGEAVVQLQMMNPILINVEVDSATDSRLNYGDFVYAYPPDSPDQPMKAMVYETASVADPSTRTFLIQLLILNEKVVTGLPAGSDSTNDVRTRQMTGVFQEFEDAKQPYYLNEDSIYHDEQGDFVFRIREMIADTRVGNNRTEFTVEKVNVTLGSKRLSIFDVASFRELKELGTITPHKDLFVGQILAIDGSPISREAASARLEKSLKINLVRERWQLRPGDFLDVELGEKPLVEGLYVPMDTIVKRTGSPKSSVFALHDPEGAATVREVPVQVFPTIESDKLVRIRPIEEGSLSEGSLLISKGAHYLVDGESVRATNLLEVTE